MGEESKVVQGLYCGPRYCDPGINRFITEDDVQYSTITNPITLNRYVYALNNPETNSDPSGDFILLSLALGETTVDESTKSMQAIIQHRS